MTHLDTSILFFCLFGFLLSLFLGLVVPAFGRRTALVDRSEVDAQGRPVSRAGGTALFLAWSVTLSIAGQLQGDLLMMLGCVAGAWLIGLHDDFVDSSPRLRLLGLSALAVVAASLGLAPERVFFPGGVELVLGGAAVLRDLWILGATVAFNHRRPGRTCPEPRGSCRCMLRSFRSLVSWHLLPSVLRRFKSVCCLEQASSLFLSRGQRLQRAGLALGCLSIGSLRVGEAFPVITALLLIGVPVADAATTMLRRARGVGSLFQSDLNHLHHRALKARGGG